MTQASIISIFGMRGSGKSTLTRLLSEQAKFSRKIVFDYVNEWSEGFIVTSLEEFCNIWRENFHKKSFTIIVQFEFGLHPDLREELVSKIVTIIYKTGMDSKLSTCLIFEEAQFYFPTHGLNPVMLSLITTGRHANISMIANTQRPASVSKLLISQSPEIYIGKLFEMNDIKYLYETVGETALQAKNLKSFEFIYFEQGYPENTQVITL